MWQYHDSKLIELSKLYKKTSKQTQNMIQELIDTFNFNNENLYNIASMKDKKRINSYIEEWKDKGLLNGYFALLANNIYKRARVKNSEILELLMYSAYIEEQSKLNDKEQELFKEDIEYYYNEGINEVRKAQGKQNKYSVIPDAIFLALLDEINSMGYTWQQQVEIMARNNANQLYRQVVINLMQQKPVEVNSDEFQRIINNQIKQKININGDKISGALDLELLTLNNRAKIKGIESEDNNAKVVFLANVDGTETPMCHSLNNQEFYINKENIFDRYYGDTPKTLSVQRVRCKGLVAGLNLPPINHHFHWCRSIVQYIPRIVEKQEKEEYNIDNFLRTELYNNQNYNDYIKDYQQVRKEYDMLPDNVKNRLFSTEKIKVVFNYNGRNTSGYNPNTKEILLLPNIEEGEFIHEIGHALYYSLNVKNYKSYQDIIDNIIKNGKIEEFRDRAVPYYGLDTSYNIASNYQTFIGYDKVTAQVRINKKELVEIMSEAYREFYYGKKQSKELNDLVEEVEKNA